jgi:dCTP deaminase
VLSDSAIVERLLDRDPKRRIVISPMISAPEQIGPSSIDVHLGTEFTVVERSDRVQFDPLMTRHEYMEWLNHVKSASRHSVLEQFILHPGEFALAATLEFICIPETIVGHIDGRSSWGRQGLKVHSTAGNIHPGSRGFVAFELENAGPVPIVLYPGLAIAQLTFDEVQGEVLEDYSARGESRYAGVLDMLWSAYPDDGALKAMRSLKKRQLIERPSATHRPRSQVVLNADHFLTSADGAADGDHFEENELLNTVAGCLQMFDKRELFDIAEAVLAITGYAATGDAERDIAHYTHYTESQLRCVLVEQCKSTNAADLNLIRKLVIAFLRQKMRRA